MIPLIAWLCSVLGIAIAWVVILGNAMSTAPSKLTVGVAILLSFLPVIAICAVVAGFSKSIPVSQQGKAILIYSIPLIISLFSLGSTVISMEHKWLKKIRPNSSGSSSSIVETFQRNRIDPDFRLEFRQIIEDSESDSTEERATSSDNPLQMGDEVLLSNQDVDFTSVRGPYSVSGFAIGITFTLEGGKKLNEFSRRDIGKRWAVLINGKVVATPEIKFPFRKEVAIENHFDKDTALSYARGIVQGTQ